MKVCLPLMKNKLTPLAKSVLLLVGLPTAAAGAGCYHMWKFML